MQMAAEGITQQRAVPPHDPAAEQAVLGGILIDNTAFDRVNLTPEDFYDRCHGMIFRTMQRMAAAGTSIDVVTLPDALRACGKLQEVGGATYLSELVDRTPSAANISSHARIVREKVQARSLMKLTTNIYQRAHAGEPVADLYDSLRQRVDALAGLHQDPAGEAFTFEAWADLKNATQEQEEYVVDQLLPKNWLSLLLGDPKVGKSQLVGTLVQAVAPGGRCLDRDTQPGPVLLLALEEARFAVKRRFEKIGLSSDAPVHIVFKRPPRDPLGWLKRQIKQYQPALVVIDTLVRLIDFREINDYAKTAQDMAPLLAIVRESGAHMMALHHTRKSGGEHGAEAMASQAIYATADMKLNITREGEQRRYLTSDGRDHGRIQEPLLLHMDETTGLISAGGTKTEIAIQTIADNIVAFLKNADGPVPRAEIEKAVKGKGERLGAALKMLVEQGKIEQHQAGRKHFYSLCPNENVSKRFPAFPEGREKLNGNDSEELDPKIRTFPTPYIEGNGKSSKTTISDHAAGLNGATRDEAIN